MIKNISIEEMINANMHFGHTIKNSNPKMKKFILEKFNGIYIIDLDKTKLLINKISKILFNIIKNKKKILFIGTKKSAKESVKNIAIKYNQFFINNRWMGGTLTNWSTIKSLIKKLNYLNNQYNNNLLNKLTKKESTSFKNNINKMENDLSGIKNMEILPDFMFIVDINKENIAVKEANKLNIPIFGLVDTNSNPDNIDYVIPINDDSTKSVSLCLNFISEKINFYFKKNE